MVKKFNFRGLMAPVFTAFNDDNTVNCNNIRAYAKYLKDKEIDGVLVNGTTGEGMSMTVNERKKVAEEWLIAGDEYKITVMVQIGGTPYPDVLELAQHAERIGVDAVLCLPELYFKPNTEAALIEYLLPIAKRCPTIPFLYYHIPMFTNVALDMNRFCMLAKEKIPNFVGIKYTSGDLQKVVACANTDLAVFIGADSILTGAFALGFDSAIATTLNIFPEISQAILRSVKEENLAEARRFQKRLNDKIADISKRGKTWFIYNNHLFFNYS